MSLADEMRTLSEKAGNSKADAAFASVMEIIKGAAERGRREIVWAPYIHNYKELGYDDGYISDREEELLKEKLENSGFRIVQPNRISAGVRQTTKYIQW